MAGGTVRKIAGVVAGVLDTAVKKGRLGQNAARGLDLLRQAMKRRRYLNAGEVELLARTVEDHKDRAEIVYVLAYCGLRIGELAALKVTQVDVLRRRFRIEESVTEVNGKLVWSSPKDHQRRTVSWPAFLDEYLSAVIGRKRPPDLLFPATGGGVLRVRNMRRDWFDAAATTAGVAGLTPHELRHTAVSLAVSSGASVLALQRMLGHDKPATTLNVCSDLFDADLDELGDRVTAARTKTSEARLRPNEKHPGQAEGETST